MRGRSDSISSALDVRIVEPFDVGKREANLVGIRAATVLEDRPGGRGQWNTVLPYIAKPVRLEEELRFPLVEDLVGDRCRVAAAERRQPGGRMEHVDLS